MRLLLRFTGQACSGEKRFLEIEAIFISNQCWKILAIYASISGKNGAALCSSNGRINVKRPESF